MLILASSQPPSPTDSYCPKRWSCPCSSLYLPCLDLSCLQSEPAQLPHVATNSPNQRKLLFFSISEFNQFIPEGQLQGGAETAWRRLRKGEGYVWAEGHPAWWHGSAGSAVSEPCPKHSFLGIHQDANSVKLIL